MEIKCPKCSTITVVEVDFKAVNFGCPNCKNLFSVKEGIAGKEIRKYNHLSDETVLAVGDKGKLEGKDYVVTGLMVKRVASIYYWREYMLTTAEGEKAYLSETNGHWILLHEIPDEYDVTDYPRTLDYNDTIFRLYDYESALVVQAEGFFDYELSGKNVKMVEYINPPYIISFEKEDNEETTFYGKHISKGEVKRAFSISSMPSKTGTGIVQPFLLSVRNLGIILSAFSILILVSHLVIYNGREEKNVLSETLSFYDYNNKDFVSKPFTLEGGSAPLTVSVSSNVDNSWASMQVGLINEATHEEVYASKDIEYYHGYEGGESWSEGSTGEKFNICGVSAGRYHLVLTPSKAPEGTTANTMSVVAVWNQPSLWNVFIPIIIMIGVIVGAYFINLNFERNRWADSSFSPYE